MSNESLNLDGVLRREELNIQISTLDVLTAFIKQTLYTDNKVFVFNTPAGDGDRFVQRLRTELSRKRKLAKEQGVELQHFKMILDSIECEPTHDRVTLRYHQSEANIINEDVSELIALMKFEAKSSKDI